MTLPRDRSLPALARALRAAALLLALLGASGCYFYYPKLPKTARPALVEGEEVQILSQENEYMQSCEPRQRDCGLTRSGEWKRPAKYYTAEARYNGRTLTQYELRQLVDPKFDEKLARVKRNKGACNVSLVPSVISVVGLAALSIAGPFYEQLGDAAVPVALGASAAMVGGGLLSYPLGGYACRRARRQYKEMFVGVSPEDTSFIIRENIGDEKGSVNYVDEVVELAKDFNARFGGSRKAESSGDADDDDRDADDSDDDDSDDDDDESDE